MHSSLVSVQKALKGLVVLSAELEAMGTAMFNQVVPANWTKVAYPSLKPCTPWFRDLMARLAFVQDWVDHGVPSNYWISGFFFPQGFLTACLQNYARAKQFPIDTVSFSYVMKEESPDQLSVKPEFGVYIHGLFLEGARWDMAASSLVDPKPKELFSPMPVIHMLPQQNRETPQSGIYRCPVYKILTRTGTLSTTGHSTNFVVWIEIPSNRETIYRSSLVSETNAQVLFCDNDDWIKAGVACFCSLRY
jgi:dynein heavy chain